MQIPLKNLTKFWYTEGKNFSEKAKITNFEEIDI